MHAADVPDLVAELGELIAIPSVSADPDRKADVRAAAEWVCGYVERAGGRARVEADGVLALGEVQASAAAAAGHLSSLNSLS